GKRFGAQEDGGRPRSFVCVVNPLPVCGRGSNGQARFFQSLHRLFVHAEDRHVRIVRLFVGFQHLFHVGNALGVRFRWHDPVCDLPMRHTVFFRVRRTVSSLTESTMATATTLRANKRSVQLLEPCGGGPRRVAMLRASWSPVNRFSTGGCLRSTRLSVSSHPCSTNRWRSLSTVLVRHENASAIRSSVHVGPSASAFSRTCARRTFWPVPF